MIDSPAARKLVNALKSVGASDDFVKRAEEGYYGDFTSDLAMPITQLVNDSRAAGLSTIAGRAMNGEFDGE
jgi:hypothetical protein